MPRAAKDTKMDTRESRSRLAVRTEPYWRSVQPGVFLGYRKGKTGGAWIARTRQGEGYAEARLGMSDDASAEAADGELVLSYAQAITAALNFARTAVAPKPARTYGQGTMVAQALSTYLDDLQQRRPGSSGIATARQQADRYILPKLGERLVSSLQTKELTAFVKAVANTRASVRGKGPQTRVDRSDYDLSDPDVLRARFETAKRIWTTLRAALTHAWRLGLDGVKSDSEWRRVKLSAPAVEEKTPRMLSEAEVQALLSACTAPDLQLLVEACLHTGARFGELVRMRVADFSRDAVAIRQTKPINPKTLHQPLTREGAEFFARVAAGRAPTEVLFLRSNGEPWGKNQHSKPMLQALADAGIQDASFKTLRATYGKRLLLATGDLEKVRQALGHADQRITRKHYAAYLKGEMAEAVANLPRLQPEAEHRPSPNSATVVPIKRNRTRA